MGSTSCGQVVRHAAFVPSSTEKAPQSDSVIKRVLIKLAITFKKRSIHSLELPRRKLEETPSSTESRELVHFAKTPFRQRLALVGRIS
jgi:hypothetical protein